MWILDGNSASSQHSTNMYNICCVPTSIEKQVEKKKWENLVSEIRSYLSTVCHAYLAEILITFGYKIKIVATCSKFQALYFDQIGFYLPATNSVPASSAVARKSSMELCSVTDCRFSLPQS